MKAMVYQEYGSPDNLEVQEPEVPTVKDDEVLVRVHAAAVHVSEWVFVRGVPYIMRPMIGLLRPKNRVPGEVIAGKVEAVGRKVQRLRLHARVAGCARARSDKTSSGLVTLFILIQKGGERR